EGVQAGADGIHAQDAVADGHQAAVNNRPDEQQDGCNDDREHGGDDGDAAFAAEESQPVRQLGALELVVADSADNAGDDADELVLDVVERNVRLGAGDGGDDGGVQQLGDHQPGNQAGQTSGAVLIVGQANGNADGKQPGHVVDQGAAGLHQEETDDLNDAG